MRINITENEYMAICEALNNLASGMEAATEEYAKSIEQTIKFVCSVLEKCSKARRAERFNREIYKECKKTFPNESPTALKRIVSLAKKEIKKRLK